MSIEGLSDGFDRSGGVSIRRSAMESLANTLGCEIHDAKRVVSELVRMCETRQLNDYQMEMLDDALDRLQQIDSLDRPWVFGHRYCGHKFVSIDPVCVNCHNQVPHRTILRCPTCGAFGPWEFEERRLASSHIHFVLLERITRLFSNELLLSSGDRRADSMASAIPRGGAKSTWLCEIFVLWIVLTVRSRCTLLLSNTLDQVEQRATEIKTELEENTLLLRDFGVQEAKRTDPRTWTASDFILANGGRVVARAAGSSMRGVKNKQYRPDVTVWDDADDDKYCSSPIQADKMYEWADKRVIPACHPNAVHVMHGTVISELALLWKTLTGHRGGTSVKTIVQAVNDFPGCTICGMPAPLPGPFNCPVCRKRTVAAQPCSFWGARFTVEALRAIQARIGYWAFQTEFQQNVHDDTTSWFEKDWLTRATDNNLRPPPPIQRRIVPWSIIRSTIDSREAYNVAIRVSDVFKRAGQDDLGPYQLILQSWDPAWARKKKSGEDSKNAYMAAVTAGLTLDDRLDIFFSARKKALPGTAAYREWMYKHWKEDAEPTFGATESRGQTAMIIETNGAGVLFQYEVENHWASVPVVYHQTGDNKHSLHDGIPGLASWFHADRVVIRYGGCDPELKADMDELVYELKQSGKSAHKDLLMALWFLWSKANEWIRDVRDPARYDELTRRTSK